MRRLLKNKLHSSRGINRLVVILLILVIALGIALAIPGYQAYKRHSDQIGCTVALKKAQDSVDIAYLNNYSLTKEEAQAVVERSKWEQDALCPAGGDYYLLEQRDRDQVYLVTCGLHEQDTRLRTRLNATHVYGLLQDELLTLQERDMDLPEEGFTFTVNSQPLPVQRLQGDNGLRRGTASTVGFEGIVCFFSLSDAGGLTWFVYADENHAAVWRLHDGWSGDAYSIN